MTRRGLQLLTSVGTLAMGLLLIAGSTRAGRDAAGQEEGAACDSSDARRSSLIPLPFYFYTPETESAFGVTVSYYFRLSGEGPREYPSSILPVLIYTTKDQTIASVLGDIYLDRGRYRVTSSLAYMKFPFTFWGVGNAAPDGAEENYTPRVYSVELQLQRRIASGWFAGGMAAFARRELLETVVGGLLETRAVAGAHDGQVVSVGFLITRDTRDNAVFPASGSYHQMKVAVFDGVIGSDSDHASHSIDLRRYVSAAPGHVVAVQGVGAGTTAAPPFDVLPMLGGESLLRGYFEGRYRDRFLLAGQIEYRARLWRRLGAVGFAAAGRVAHTLDAFGTDSIRTAAGLGLRFLLVRKEQLNLRLDWGFGQNTSGLYLGMGEAF